MNTCFLSHIWKDNISQDVMVFKDLIRQFCSSTEVFCAGKLDGYLHPWGCLAVRPCIMSLKLLRDFEQSNSCFGHAIFHNCSLTESPTYIAVLWPTFLFHASPVCPLVLCCNSGGYFPVSVIPTPSPFIFCTWCSSSSVSLSRVITLLYKCTVCSWEQGYIYVTSAF